MGKASSEKLSVRTTSWQAPLRTDFGKNDPISASLGSIFTFSSRPCGDCKSRNELMRAATSSSESTSRARHIRRSVPTRLVTTGMREPFGRSNSNAGPAAFTARSEISVISRTGSTSSEMRRSSSCFSSLWMKSRRSLCATSAPCFWRCHFSMEGRRGENRVEVRGESQRHHRSTQMNTDKGERFTQCKRRNDGGKSETATDFTAEEQRRAGEVLFCADWDGLGDLRFGLAGIGRGWLSD